MGLLGVIFPEEYGGAGLGYIEYVIAIEELSRVDGSVGIIVAAHNSLCSNHIYKFGTEEQKKKYLTPLVQGKKIGAWSLTEPEAGSDAGGTRTTAVRDGKHWVLNGAKTFCTNGHYADTCVAMAVTDKSKNSHGISAFIVEKGTPGFKPGKKENKLGPARQRYVGTHFHRLPRPGRQFARRRRRRIRRQPEDSRRRPHLDCGARRSAWRKALWMRPRNTPSNASNLAKPSASFRPSSSSWPTWPRKWKPRDCWSIRRRGWPTRKDVRFTKESSMAKLFASEVAVRVANECVQIHGGYGFIKDYPAEKFYRDVKLCTIGEGTSEIQKLVIARQLLGKK